MMNKIIKGSLAAALFIFASASFAAPSLSTLKIARGHLPAKTMSQTETKAAKATAGHYYATEVTIINNVPEAVFVTIPGSNIIHETLYANEKVYFYSNDYFDFVRVVLFDIYNGMFFDGYVPNYQTLYTSDYFYNFAAKRNAAKTK